MTPTQIKYRRSAAGNGRLAIHYIETGDVLAASGHAALAAHYARRAMRLAATQAIRKRRDDLYASLGMVRVRGALGGVYYE